MGITIRPPENVYRKPHELVSSAAYLSAALGTVFLPVPPAAAPLSAPVLLALSALRAKQGLRSPPLPPQPESADVLCHDTGADTGVGQSLVSRQRFQMDADPHPASSDGKAA